jgi:D-beta-D-heptose 7-phosphate kinase / D-beta-D-heptose 1-phosphate adenosyltransferase
MFDFEHRLSDLNAQTVLCVGDLMLDEFVYGEVSRISPEAPAQVIAVGRQESTIGGAGNVARNVASLGAHCLIVGVVGEDEAGRTLMARLQGEPKIEPYLVVHPTRPTTRKVRFVSESHSTHLLRADYEVASAVDGASETLLIERALAVLPRAGAVVLSDYAKGTLTERVIRAVIDGANALAKPVVVDPKRQDVAVYRGATVIKPNRKELGEATRRPVADDAEVAAAASEFRRLIEAEAVLVSRSDEGLTLVTAVAPPVHVSAYPVKVRDVSGAGDTVVAAFSAFLAMGADFESAMRAANAAAAVVVGKRGTAAVSAAELRSRIVPAASLAAEEKVVFDWSALDERLAEWRRRSLRIGFTNGCFDLLHRGHIKVLTEARSRCDRLIVGLNSDSSAARLKGDGRPINKEHERAQVLAALEAVDLVVVFAQDTPIELIEKVRPMVLVKGGDYRREEVVGHELVEAAGGEVVLVDIVPGQSTTRIVEKSRALARAAPAMKAKTEKAL